MYVIAWLNNFIFIDDIYTLYSYIIICQVEVFIELSTMNNYIIILPNIISNIMSSSNINMIFWYNIYVWLFQYIHNMDLLKYQIRLANRSFCMKGLKLYDTIEHKYYALFFYLHTELLITWKCKIICYVWFSLLYLYNFIFIFWFSWSH